MRHKLSLKTSVTEFESTYYLKQQLVDFCRENNIPTSGSKQELTDRVREYLTTGKVKPTSKFPKRANSDTTPPSLEKVITEGYRNTEENREFFEKHIVRNFRFSVKFQKWMKSNIGKTFEDAINAWHEIENEKKANRGKNKIDSQFEYNQYTRDFFKYTTGLSKADCIKCWKYKRDKPGSNKFEMSDLEVLGNNK